MEELIDYTDDKLNNLDKNILVDTLKHTSDIMTALSNKVYIMEEEIKNIQEQLLSLSNENKLLKESLKNNNFDKLYKVNQNINITYDNDNQKNDDNQNKETKDTVNKILEIKKEEVSGNIVNNRKKNNLFIRKI
jgi:hypothetical protein